MNSECIVTQDRPFGKKRPLDRPVSLDISPSSRYNSLWNFKPKGVGSMKRVTDTELVERIGSKYALTTAVYRRAQQLMEGAKPLVRTDTTNPVAIAIEEIRAGLIKVFLPEPRNVEVPE